MRVGKGQRRVNKASDFHILILDIYPLPRLFHFQSCLIIFDLI